MKSTLVDSNVLIDLFDEDSEWRDWSDAMITHHGTRGALVINPVIYAEVAAGFDSIEDAVGDADRVRARRRRDVDAHSGIRLLHGRG